MLVLGIGLECYAIVSIVSERLDIMVLILLIVAISLLLGFMVFAIYFLAVHYFVTFELLIGEIQKDIDGKRVPLSNLADFSSFS